MNIRFLELPESFTPVLGHFGELQLAYIKPNWRLLVCTEHHSRMFGFCTGRELQHNWERSAISQFNTPAAATDVADYAIYLPSGRYAAVSFLHFHTTPAGNPSAVRKFKLTTTG